MTILEVAVYWYALREFGELTAKSYSFILLVYLCLFRSFSCRSETKTYFELPFNKWHLASVLAPIILQFGLEHTEFYQKVFKVRGLTLQENVVLFLISIIPVSIVEILKVIKRPRGITS